MTQPEWQRLEEWFALATELDGEARAVFLRERTGEDPALARELEGLLAAHAESAAAFRQPIVPQLKPAPSQAGEWQLREILGEGGLGVVRRAERTRHGVIEQGAVKYVHAGYDTGPFRARFLKERTILRTLDHPAIARLLDGGVDGDGRPYLVMEYVEGRSWSDFLEQSRPSSETRARLFLDLLNAVSYLHGRHVVHGDIKPSNVMVTSAAGQVKLLDFGAARMLDPFGQPRDSTFTRAMLTPGWASPEQMSGGACTAQSDIYSLGLLLRLSPTAAGADADLSAIADQATRTEPEERYASAQAMADDVDRYLRRRPVAALSGNRWYRLRKFGQQNRVALALAACLAVASSAGLWLWFTQRSRTELVIATVRGTPSPQQAIAAAASAVAPPPAPGATSTPSPEQVDVQLLLAYVKLNGGECDGVDGPLEIVRAALPKMPPGRPRDMAQMRYLLLRGLCDAHGKRTPASADLIDRGFQLRDKLGAPDRFKPIFGTRLSQLGRNFIDDGEVARGARIMRWAAVEALRAGRPREAAQAWLRLLTRLSREPDTKLLGEYCRMEPPVAVDTAAVCGPAGQEASELTGAEQAIKNSPASIDALSRAVAAHQAASLRLSARGRHAEARAHAKRRIELLDRLLELEPGNQRWQVMRRRSLMRFQKGAQPGEP